MVKKCSVFILTFIVIVNVRVKAQVSLFSLDKASAKSEYLYGKPENSKYLFVTAGNKLYAIGNQAGNFPEVGFHIPKEMGGIWQHPIKLMDGYRVEIGSKEGVSTLLSKSDKFISYPFATKNIYRIKNPNVQVTRTQFVPDGIPVLVVEYGIKNESKMEKSYQLRIKADIDLRPVWLGKKYGMYNGSDFLSKKLPKQNTFVFRDHKNNWFSAISSDIDLELDKIVKSPFKGKGKTEVLNTSINVDPGETRYFHIYIGGSTITDKYAVDNLEIVKENLRNLFYKKESRYNKMKKVAHLEIPDKKLQEAWRWGKYTSDWLIRYVKGMGQGMSAGLPDYPWFFSNDQAYTFEALVGIKNPQLFYDSWKMLKNVSNRANNESGRVIHEVSTNGVVVDKGRMEESQLHIEAAWKIFKWTGNKDFLKRNYSFAKRTLSFLMKHDKDNDLFVEGYGGAEIKGMNSEMLDVAVHTQRLFHIMSKMADIFHEDQLKIDYEDKAQKLKNKINKIWWVDSEHRYADFLAEKQKALKVIDQALKNRTSIDRNQWAIKKLNNLKTEIKNNNYKEDGYVVYYNSSGILPLEVGIADSIKAKQALNHISYFTNKYGMYISGIERPDDISIDEGSVYSRKNGEFSYNQAVMPAATSGLAIAECRYGSTNTALKYIHKILNSFSYATPGTTYEVSPDYGMFVQAWNVRGIYIPLVKYFFGINPQAFRKEIRLNPKFPSNWNYAKLNNLLIGDNQFSIDYKKEGNMVSYILRNSDPDWSIDFHVPSSVSDIWINGKLSKNKDIVLDGSKNEIKFQQK